MPKIRLNKAVKEFNISMSRLVEFLQTKGFEVESNPNAQLEEAAYSALQAEFAKDGEQRKASHEVVISKVPEEKLELEEKKPEVIRAKSQLKAETKVLGKIDLDAKSAEPEAAPEVPKAVEPAVEESTSKETPEKSVEEQEKPQRQEFNVLGKIDLSKIESSSKPKTPKAKPTKAVEPAKEPEPAKEAEVAVSPTEEKIEQPEVKSEIASHSFEEPAKHKTLYQKLDGPKILEQKVDLSQFQSKSKASADKKKKRKRIEKPVSGPGSAQGTAGAQTGNRPGQGGTRPGQGGQNRPGQAGNKKGGRRGEKVMPVELSDEDVKNQIRETLEKLTNKGGKSKGAKHRREKRSFRREQDELQQEMDAQD